MTTQIRSPLTPATSVSVLDIEQALNDHLSAMEALVEAGREVHGLMDHYETARTEAAVRLAAILARAKATDPQPASSWSLCMGKIGLSDDAAGDLLAIHRLGLDARAVLDLGGVSAAGSWARGLRLPRMPLPDEVLAFDAREWQPRQRYPIACVWPVDGGYCLGFAPSFNAEAGVIVTLDPVTDERLIWQHLWRLFTPRPTPIRMACLHGPWVSVLGVLEKQRQEMLRDRVDMIFNELVKERV